MALARSRSLLQRQGMSQGMSVRCLSSALSYVEDMTDLSKPGRFFGGGLSEGGSKFAVTSASPSELLDLLQRKSRGKGNKIRRSELQQLVERVRELETDDEGEGEKNGRRVLLGLDLFRGEPVGEKLAYGVVSSALDAGVDGAVIAKTIVRNSSISNDLSTKGVTRVIANLSHDLTQIEDKKEKLAAVQTLVDHLQSRGKKSKNGRLPVGKGMNKKSYTVAAKAFVRAGDEGRARRLLESAKGVSTFSEN